MYESQNVTTALSRISNDQINSKENRTGFYRAIVVNNIDTDNLARVRIRIPSFHGTNEAQSYYVPDNRLPFAYPASFNGAGNKMGEYIIPVVGSLVWVSFETGTDNFIYFGGVYTANPTGNRVLYFDRSTNSGQAEKIIENDIPSDYNPNRYVIFRSHNGAEIVVDDRDKCREILIKDQYSNQIKMNMNGITILSKNPLNADYPYLHTYYTKASNVPDDVVFNIGFKEIFQDQLLTTNTKPIKGSKIAYISNNKCVGSGIVTNINIADELITISSNGIV